MALIWAQYFSQPYLETYQKLKQHADRISQWGSWRQKALAALRQAIGAAKQKATRSPWAWAGRADHSALVQIFLWEKDLDAAWSEAKGGGCTDDLWLELAAKREKDHPEDALAVYRAQVEPTVAQKNDDAYREAIGLLRKSRGLLIRLGREPEFGDSLAALRLAHKPKRNFMKLLDHAKW